MTDYRLDKRELAELRAAHRQVRDVREACRINAVILLGRGRTVADVADALLFDPGTVRSYFKRYKEGGLDGCCACPMSAGGQRREIAVGV